MIQTTCPNCGRNLSIDESLGKTAKCDGCGCMIAVVQQPAPVVQGAPPPLPQSRSSTDVPPPMPPQSSTSAASVHKMGTRTRVALGCGGLLLLFFFICGIIGSIADSNSGKKSDVSQSPPASTASSSPSSTQNASKDAPNSPAPSSSANPGVLKRQAPAAEIETDAKTVDREFSENRLAFEGKYVGKTIGVRGEVGQVSSENGSVTLMLLGTDRLVGTNQIACMLQPSEGTLAEGLDAGDKVRIVGLCATPQSTVFGSDYVRIQDAVIAEMPDKSAKKAESEQGGSGPVTLKELVEEISDNQPRALKKYGGKRILFRAKWDRVEKNDDGLPELHLASLFPPALATCTLRQDQLDAASRLDVNNEVVIDTVFEGGDGNWEPFRFSDGVLNPDINKKNVVPSASTAESTPAQSPAQRAESFKWTTGTWTRMSRDGSELMAKLQIHRIDSQSFDFTITAYDSGKELTRSGSAQIGELKAVSSQDGGTCHLTFEPMDAESSSIIATIEQPPGGPSWNTYGVLSRELTQEQTVAIQKEAAAKLKALGVTPEETP